MLGSELRLLGDLLTAPRRGFAALAAAPPIAAVFVVLGLLQAGLWVAQSLLLQPLLAAGSELGDASAGGAPAPELFWLARALLVLLTPIAMGLRAAGLAALLQAGTAIWGRAMPYRPLFSLALHLEVVLWLESAAVTLLLAVAQPASAESLHLLRLRAGVDLLWRPAGASAASLLAAANFFSVWWGLLLALGLVHVACLPRRAAALLASSSWAGLVAVRFFLDRS